MSFTYKKYSCYSCPRYPILVKVRTCIPGSSLLHRPLAFIVWMKMLIAAITESIQFVAAHLPHPFTSGIIIDFIREPLNNLSKV